MSLPYYRWFPGDYMRDTRRLTMLQHGAYRLLIDEYMSVGKPLPNDLPALYRACMAFSGEEQAAIQYVLAEFFRLDGPVWRHKRCDEELARQSERSASARKSIGARWGKQDTNVIRTNNDRNTIQNQNQNQNQKESANALSRARAQETPVALSIALRKAGIQSNSSDPRLIALAEQGTTVDVLMAAVATAKDAKKGAPVPLGYVIGILEGWAQRASGIKVAGARPDGAPDTDAMAAALVAKYFPEG